MHPGTLITKLAIILMLGLIVLPGCGRGPDEEATTETVPQEVAEPETLVSLPLPQTNPDLGLTVAEVPAGFVATYNEDVAIELADTTRPGLRYSLFVDRPGLPYRSPSNQEDYEIYIGGYTDGRVIDRGDFDTPFGVAAWAQATYFEEDQSFEDLRVFVPHPSGSGTVIVVSVCPEGMAPLDDRLDSIKELVALLE
ncbi:MAG: hypothetical protein V2I67_00665 [Thermoanaerobaculales bacterium]|jgi:hypothetical protein|nr:hypothetical protein [Thermoanaerobaculales bacterium]